MESDRERLHPILGPLDVAMRNEQGIRGRFAPADHFADMVVDVDHCPCIHG
jgi:hypothetical protein